MKNLPLGKVAGSAAILKDSKILLLQRAKSVSVFPGYWTFPSGGVEETDATIQDTAIREAKEEVGLVFVPTKKFNFYESAANGKRYFALVHLGEWLGEVTLQTTEVSQWKFFTYKETKEVKLAFAYREVIDDLYTAELIV